MQNHVHDTEASQIEKLGWGEHRTPAAAVYSTNNAFISSLQGKRQFIPVRKPALYLLHENGPIHQVFRRKQFTAIGGAALAKHPPMSFSVGFTRVCPRLWLLRATSCRQAKGGWEFAPAVTQLLMLRCPAARTHAGGVSFGAGLLSQGRR